jgi:hypothetical protein
VRAVAIRGRVGRAPEAKPMRRVGRLHAITAETHQSCFSRGELAGLLRETRAAAADCFDQAGGRRPRRRTREHRRYGALRCAGENLIKRGSLIAAELSTPPGLPAATGAMILFVIGWIAWPQSPLTSWRSFERRRIKVRDAVIGPQMRAAQQPHYDLAGTSVPVGTARRRGFGLLVTRDEPANPFPPMLLMPWRWAYRSRCGRATCDAG